MLRTKPKLAYCGLTIVLSNPSRFDTLSLLSATGGSLFNDWCLRPDNNIMQCDVRLADEVAPLLPNTKCVLLCGEYAMKKLLPELKSNSIGEMRGSPISKNGIIHIPTFFPQDAADLKTYEQQLNTESKEYQPDASEYDNDDEGDAKRHGKTARRNYAFWLRADTKKSQRIIRSNGSIPDDGRKPVELRINPLPDVCIKELTCTKGKLLYFDIETDYEEQNLQCFAFSFGDGVVYSVPVLDYNYRPANPHTHKILRALAVAIRDNTVVAHNGAAFDFFVLAYKYGIPVVSCYDTMIAMHRCYPDVEKSLGHCTSLWTYERFHKDEDSQGYMTRDQMYDRLRYCAKDVATMHMIHQEIIKFAATIPGLQDSINTAMNAIVPYLITSLQGIRYNHEKVAAISAENDGLMKQYLRCCNMLIGETGLKEIAQYIKGKAKSFPGSNAQCCAYFHDILGYPVVARSKKTDKPSLAKNAMFKLALKHENPVLQFTLAFREVQKSFGTLQFHPWKDNNNNVYKIPIE